MTVAGLWQEIGAGENSITRFLRLAFIVAAAVVFCFLASLPLTWQEQSVCGLLTLLMAMALARSSDSYLITLALTLMSIFSTVRYGYWRVTQTALYFQDPGTHWGALDAFFILCLLAAEAYAFLVLLLGFFQTLWPLRRAPVELPDDETAWPHVDILVPTRNEPLDVVRYTVLGALNIDWPADKLHVYILDDGRRSEFEAFAFEAGVGYRSRPDHRHAKAGNINAALATVDSPFIAVFDSDHVPTRSFLQMTVGWMLRDPRLALLQTPHHFYSPDPFERNLDQFRIIPNEGELFYGIVQDGNDFWNSTFFCGSCAVLRREALDSIGGMAVETVTEDAHTSLRMQMRGWNTAYINIPQAAGLATESLSAHVGQRIRWARGMVQILRTDNPLFAPGLKFAQRLCYFNAMCHFLYAIPRLIFLTAPLVFLLLNHSIIPGYWAAILAYALPHLILANVTNSRIQGEHRHSFWNEIYETVLSPYILLPTVMALLSPKQGRFNVTAKGGVVKQTYFDGWIASPFLGMLVLNFIALLIAIPRYFLWDRDSRGTVVMNVAWCLFNVVILGVCTAVAREMRQMRTSVRIRVALPIKARTDQGSLLAGETVDMSPGGASIRFRDAVDLHPQSEIKLRFALSNVETELPATVVSSEGSVLRVRFQPLTLAEQEVLTMVLYSRADSWLGWGEARESDNVLRSLRRILAISFLGLKQTFLSLTGQGNSRPGKKVRTFSVARPAAIFIVASLLTGWALAGHAQTADTDPTGTDTLPGSSSAYRDLFTLKQAGAPQIELHGTEAKREVRFTLPETHTARTARMHLDYVFSPSLLPQMSHLNLYMNGALFATVQPTPGLLSGSDAKEAEADFTVPADYLVHSNRLTIEFVGHYTLTCEDPANSALWARVLRSSYFEIEGSQLALADDIKQLPAPFLEPLAVQPLSLPIVFAAMPSLKAIQAAGVVASYFGLVAEARPVRFPVYIGALPKGNVIVISDGPANLPPSLKLGDVSAPMVAMRANPYDPFGKVLVIAGATAAQALVAAQAVAMQTDMLSGAQTPITTFKLPAPRAPDDAPRWAQTSKPIALGDYATTDQLQSDGSTPLSVTFRLPPDIDYASYARTQAARPNALLRLQYRFNSIPIGPISSLQVKLNNTFLSAAPLSPGQEASRPMQADVAVPVGALQPFSNTLQFAFAFQNAARNDCQAAPPASMAGAVVGDSYLDLHHYPHYASLPNLQTFADAGFPFTRLADLAGTVVVLPSAPTPQEIETFLTLMGHFGRQTGYPALRVTVAGPEAMHDGAGADFLVIGTGDDQPGIDKLNPNLPVTLRGGQFQVRDTQGFFAPLLNNAWWKSESWKSEADQHVSSGDITAAGTPDALIEGLKSPFGPGNSRSIVVLHFKDAASVEPFLAAFLNPQQPSDIAGSVAVLHGARFQSFRIGAEVYHLGLLPWWVELQLWLMQYPYLVSIAIFLITLLLAVWIRQALRAKARARLQMTED